MTEELAIGCAAGMTVFLCVMTWRWKPTQAVPSLPTIQPEHPVTMDTTYEWVKQDGSCAYNYARKEDGAVLGEILFHQ